MISQNLKSLQFRCMAVGLLLAGLTVGLAIDVFRDSLHPARAQPLLLEKRELALRGDLELERAVQALKDCILRGEPSYSEDFTRHMEEVDRAAFQYREGGRLDQVEEEALGRLNEALPKYRAALYSVHQMRAKDAPITEIDTVVKGEDRPISAAFRELEAAASDPNAFGRFLFREAAVVTLCALFAGTLLYFSFATRVHQSDVDGDSRSLRELSNRIVHWEEERESRAFSVLHDKVCQSLSAIMYLLKGAEHFAPDRANASFRSNVDPIIPSLQAAIRETLAIAVDLRPPRMQESGLLGTLDSVWEDCVMLRPGLEIVARRQLKEADIPEELKPVILRIARMALDWADQESGARRLTWDLAREQGQIRLSVQVLGRSEAGRDGEPIAGMPSDLTDAIRARIVMSGGASDGARAISGGQTLLANWPLPASFATRNNGPCDTTTRYNWSTGTGSP
jgi:signal transduction histidine kinase